MKLRCYNHKCAGWKYYGQKGITVCKEWIESFDSFYQWAVSHGYDDNLVIDRINPKGNYCPNNCRWITKSKNSSRNRGPRGPYKKYPCASFVEKQKPLRQLINKLGYKNISVELMVDPSTVYRWGYREAGRKNGIKPDYDAMIGLNELSKHHRVSGLTLEYLMRL